MSSNRKTLAISDEQMEELRECFKTIDADGSESISCDELGNALDMCGITLPAYKIRNLIDQYDEGVRDGKIDIEEFKKMYAKLKAEHDFGTHFKRLVKPMEKVKNYSGTSGKSSSDTTHTTRDGEERAFSDWINRFHTLWSRLCDFPCVQIMYAFLKEEHDVGISFKKQIRQVKDVKNYTGASLSSSEGTTHTVRNAEQHAFAEWINSNFSDDPECAKYLPLDPDKDDLYRQVNDGILLCKVINKSVEDTIDERVINKGDNLSLYKKHENLTLALNSAQSIGCSVINIGAEDIEAGKPHLVLGLLWQVIKIGLLSEINVADHPGLVLLLEEGESIAQLRAMSPESILLRWVNYHLRNANLDRHIDNFGEDIQDSEVYTYLLRQIAPREFHVSLAPLQEDDRTQRAELMLQEAEKIDCRSFISPRDVVGKNKKLNLAFVANLFNKYPALDKPYDFNDEDIVEETREEKTYRNWINSLGVDPRANYLYSDLTDGLIIFALYDIIKPKTVNWDKVVRKFNQLRKRFDKLANCNYAVELGKHFKFSLVGVGGQDLLDGNETLTLALVWQLMRAYTLSILAALSKDEKTATDKEIVAWANGKLKDAGKKCSFDSFNDRKLADGKIIIDLVDALKPGVVKYSDVTEGSSPEERLQNARYAISISKRIGAKIYALPEDIVEMKNKMIMTIFACLMIRNMQKEENL